MKHINEVNVGEKVMYKVTITEKMHHGFMQLSEDDSPIHMDKNFALANGYTDCIGYAFLITAILSKIYGTIFPGGSELCLKQECNFIKPYYVNDELNFEIETVNVNESSKLLTVLTLVKRQNLEVVFKGKAVFQLCLTLDVH